MFLCARLASFCSSKNCRYSFSGSWKGLQGQSDTEPRVARGAARKADLAAVVARALPGGRQAESPAPAGMSPRVKRVKEMFELRRFRAGAVVFDDPLDQAGPRRFD